jgi:hypothetical protein
VSDTAGLAQRLEALEKSTPRFDRHGFVIGVDTCPLPAPALPESQRAKAERDERLRRERLAAARAEEDQQQAERERIAANARRRALANAPLIEAINLKIAKLQQRRSPLVGELAPLDAEIGRLKAEREALQ